MHHGRRVMEHARHRLPGALRLRQSFPGHLDTEPHTARLIPEMFRMWNSPWFTNIWETLEELAGELELVIRVKPLPRHVDVAQFDQVLHCVHVLLVVVGNMLRSGPRAHELAALALPGHSINQNVITYREMR